MLGYAIQEKNKFSASSLKLRPEIDYFLWGVYSQHKSIYTNLYLLKKNKERKEKKNFAFLKTAKVHAMTGIYSEQWQSNPGVALRCI